MSNSRTALGEILSPAGEAVDVSTLTTVPYAGVHLYAEGVYHRDDVPAEKVRAKKLRRISRGQVVYNRMWATKAAFGVVDQSADGCLVTNDFPVFVTDGTRLMPEFLRLVFASPGFQSEAAARATGTTERRRLKERDFLLIKIPLPAPEEQHRIVDLISSIDQAIHYGERYASRVADARGHLLQQLLEPSDDWAATTLGDAADIQMGQSPPGSTYNEVGDGLPFLQGSAEFGFRHPTPVKWCSAPKKKAQVGDLLVSVRAPVGDLNFADQDLAVGRGLAVVRGRSGTSTTGFLALAIERNLQELEMRSGGGMFKSITKQGLQGLPIFLPSLLEQQRIVGVTSSLEVVLSRTRSYVAAQKGLRTQALESLLSGQHEIPDSYDRFLEEAS